MKRYRPEHQRMLNNKRWRETKAIVWKRTKGLCEMCKAEGRAVDGVDCHHIIPFESARTPEEMQRLCYDPNNVQLLCVKHHIAVHAKAGSHTKEAHQQRERERLERWKQELEKRVAAIQAKAEPKPYGEQADDYLKDIETKQPQDNGTGTMETD